MKNELRSFFQEIHPTASSLTASILDTVKKMIDRDIFITDLRFSVSCTGEAIIELTVLKENESSRELKMTFAFKEYISGLDRQRRRYQSISQKLFSSAQSESPAPQAARSRKKRAPR